MTNVVQLRPQGKPGQPLPPLARRSTRVLLLASSYHDACDALEREPVSHGKPGSRLLLRSTLWRDGSYPQLERLLDDLKAHDRVLYGRFWRGHIAARKPPRSRATGSTGDRQFETVGHSPPWHQPALNTPMERRDAGYALLWLVKRMPAEIYVPKEISLAAGYGEGEAKAYERRRIA